MSCQLHAIDSIRTSYFIDSRNLDEATLEIEAKRKKLLPIMGDVIFMGLTANDIADGEYHGDCVGTLAPEIYSQIDERETQT